MDPVVLFIILGMAVVLLLTVGAPMKPIRLLGNLSVKLVVGILLLFLVNTSGTWTGLHIPINPVTASVTGILGIPGLALLVAVDQFLL